MIGAFFALILGPSRRTVRRNLQHLLGHQGFFARSRDIVLTFVQFARVLTCALAPDRPLFRDRDVKLEGFEHVRPLFERSQGLIFVTAHVGPWDVSALRLRQMFDRKVLMLMSHEADLEAEEFQDRLRGLGNLQVLRVGESPLDALPLVEHLQSGGIVVAQVDRVVQGASSLEVSLSGMPFEMPLGLFRLAGAVECPMVPVFAARLDSSTDLVTAHPPISLSPRASRNALGEAAATVAACLESHLRRFPTQWFHFVK